MKNRVKNGIALLLALTAHSILSMPHKGSSSSAQPNKTLTIAYKNQKALQNRYPIGCTITMDNQSWVVIDHPIREENEGHPDAYVEVETMAPQEQQVTFLTLSDLLYLPGPFIQYTKAAFATRMIQAAQANIPEHTQLVLKPPYANISIVTVGKAKEINQMPGSEHPIPSVFFAIDIDGQQAKAFSLPHCNRAWIRGDRYPHRSDTPLLRIFPFGTNLFPLEGAEEHPHSLEVPEQPEE